MDLIQGKILWFQVIDDGPTRLYFDPFTNFFHSTALFQSNTRTSIEKGRTIMIKMLQCVAVLLLTSIALSAKIQEKGESISQILDQEVSAAKDVSGITGIQAPSESEGAGRLFLSPSPSPSPIPVPCTSLSFGSTSSKFDGEIWSYKCFYLDVKESGTYKVTTTGSGDLDLFTGVNQYPANDCFSVSIDGNEECRMYAMKNQKLYIEIYGFSPYTDAAISISSFEQEIPSYCEELKSNEKELQFESTYLPEFDYYDYGSLCYYVKIPSRAKGYTATTSGTGDVDLYTAVDFVSTWEYNSCASNSYLSEEQCSGDLDGADILFIRIQAYEEIEKSTLTIKFEEKSGIAYKFLPLMKQLETTVEKQEKSGMPANPKMLKALNRK